MATEVTTRTRVNLRNHGKQKLTVKSVPKIAMATHVTAETTEKMALLVTKVTTAVSEQSDSYVVRLYLIF